MRTLVYIAIGVLILIGLVFLADALFWQDKEEHDHASHQALFIQAVTIVEEARTARIQELRDDWGYSGDNLMGSWVWLKAQQDVSELDEVIKILGG